LIVIGAFWYEQRPEPLSKQGADTVNARRAVEGYSARNEEADFFVLDVLE
jgi:hypothetical protein